MNYNNSIYSIIYHEAALRSAYLMPFHEATLLAQTFNQALNDMVKTTIDLNPFFSELNKAKEATTNANTVIATMVTEAKEATTNANTVIATMVTEAKEAMDGMAKITIESNEHFSELNKFGEAIEIYNSCISNLNANLIRDLINIKPISQPSVLFSAVEIPKIKLPEFRFKYPISQPSVLFSAAEIPKIKFPEFQFKYPKPHSSIPNVNQETQFSLSKSPKISCPTKIRKINLVIHLVFDK